ncbi:lysophospholipase L1-like esterase [Murinocardiopsis flavida]|uniref:Lysophospholipase L1-like esterase n=1 Tax=Murinocardiopsis flavida TaxID=645275 RepID=A0A2P8C8V0_9ACTN|nr:SGNH/GDSL hydrolase family protein [Murinocardiopsis flavida]PSK81387.1 lysophospholipase L1-like esterase [Murinocardiopsis flavida]
MRRSAATQHPLRPPSAVRVRAAVAAVLVAGTAMAVLAPAAEAAPDQTRPQPLDEHFDNVAVSEDTAPDKGDFDGAGNSISAADLSAAGWAPGQTVTLDRADLTVPAVAPGTPDNAVADGQAVQVRGRGDAVVFLVAGTGGDASGTGRIVYTDGGSDEYTLDAPDWQTGPLTTKALALPHMNTPEGTRDAKLRLFPASAPVDPDRTVRHVELPRTSGSARMHVFALNLRTPASDRTGIWSTSTSGYAPVGPWDDQTVRMVVHAGTGGHAPRLRFDNTFAAEPVEIGAATVAVQEEGATAERRPVPVSFGRSGMSVRIPAGGQAFSDPIGFRVPKQANLLVSFHLPEPVQAAPVHTAAAGTNYLSGAGSGDTTGERGGATFTEKLGVWPFLTGIDVQRGPGSVVAFGDSITDGVGSTPDTARRWPDILSDRLDAQSQVPRYGVLNQGISANRVVTDRYDGDGVSTDTGGVKAVDRVDRDILAQPGVRTLVMSEGVNDVRAGSSAEEVSAGMSTIAGRARERGIRVIAATIVPCGGYKDCTADVDRRRQQINGFLRDNSGPGETFDALLDFDKVVRDPADPTRLLPAYDSGDHLHPGDAGLRAIAESIDLAQLDPARP